MNGNFTASGDLTFGGNKLISYSPANSGQGEIISFGLPTYRGIGGGPCEFPLAPSYNQFSGIIQSIGFSAVPGNGGGRNIMNMGFDGSNGIIDIGSGDMNATFPRLLMNYYCGRDIYMCTGDLGGKIVMAIGESNGVAIGDERLPQGYKLAVKGKIIAEELNIKLFDNWPWPDYVFEPSYKLRTISELEKYLISHKHLPEMPSAKEIEKDGINTSEIISKLLKQQEELTLYIIEQNKRIEKLESIKK